MTEGETQPIDGHPRFVYDSEYIHPDQRLALDELQRMIGADPDFAQESLSAYCDAQDVVAYILRDPVEGVAATARVLNFIQRHPEGALAHLAIWQQIIGEKVDHELDYDEETRAAMATDAELRDKLIEYQKARQVGGNTDQAQMAYRHRVLGIFINRSRSVA
jgi:hypothetical protein